MNILSTLKQTWDAFLSQPGYISIFQVTLLISAVILINIIVYYMLARLGRRFQLAKAPYRTALIQSAHLPVALLIWLMSASTAMRFFIHWSDNSSSAYLALFQKLLITLLISGFLIKFIHLSFVYLKKNKFHNSIFSPSAADAIYKLIILFIIISSLLVILQIFGISISGLLAFGGLGGLMVGFAAKDTLTNLFSGIMLYLDQPFKVGERIDIPGKNISGTVERIGFRQTRIRDYYLQPIYVPNSLFSSTAVITPSRMYNRRMKHTIGIRYKDFDKVTPILKDITAFIKNNTQIDQTRPTYINMTEFGSYAINIYISCFSKATAYAEFLAVQEDLLMTVGTIIQNYQADFAFPTQTLELGESASFIQQKMT